MFFSVQFLPYLRLQLKIKTGITYRNCKYLSKIILSKIKSAWWKTTSNYVLLEKVCILLGIGTVKANCFAFHYKSREKIFESGAKLSKEIIQ